MKYELWNISSNLLGHPVEGLAEKVFALLTLIRTLKKFLMRDDETGYQSSQRNMSSSAKVP